MSALHARPLQETPVKKHDTPLKLTLCLLLSLCLAGCFVPNKYRATLSVSQPAYSFEFIGEMHIMAAYTDTYKKSVDDPRMLAHKVVNEFERVIKERQQASVETKLVSPTLFQTKFLYVSPYTLPEATGMFKMKVEGDTLTVTSRPLSEKDREMLRLNNIESRGQLCIKSFGTVLESNAHRGATLLDRCNIWNLDNLDEPVRLVVRFSKPIPLEGTTPPQP